MLANYLKMAWRNIRKQKGYSIINLSGLAIGMACCLLILLFVKDEMSYDRHHANANRIYRLIIDGEVGGSLSHFALAPFAAPEAFANEIPEVESFVRILRIGRRMIFKYQERSYEEEGYLLADETFFSIFSHSFLSGDPRTALDAPGSMVITKSTAHRLFGSEDPLGKTIVDEDGDNIHVTGIIEDVPRNSHFSFNGIISMKTLNEQQQVLLQQWLSINGWAYLLLKEGADPMAAQDKFAAITEKHTGEESREFGLSITYFLQKLTDIHLRSKLQGEIEPTGDITYIYVFSVIALFILLIACINFMNLSTARSASRAREVGLRKVFGSYRKNLIAQFLSESTLLSLAGLLVSVGLTMLALPLFNHFSGKEMTAAALIQGPVLIAMLVLIIFTGLLAGSYPAFFLSGFQPISVLQGRLSRGSRSSILRKVLVVFQFAISIALIVGTGIVLQQIKYMKNKNLGFDKEQLMVVLVQNRDTVQNFQTVKSELIQNPNIRNVSFSSVVPGQGGELRLMIPEGKSKTETYDMYVTRCDHDFLETLGMELIAGRNFSREFTTDTTEAYIVNEIAASKFGWTAEEAVGKTLTFAEGRPGKIIGVVRDFHFQPLRQSIEPLALMIEEQRLAFASVKISTVNVSETIEFVKEKWMVREPGREFSYSFMDEDFAARYTAEERLSQILSSFALLAIFIACLGLLGLASFTAEQRTKEIGIRKVLGASVNNIIFHLSKEFAKWVLIANIIAWPAIYVLMNKFWLSSFPYRIRPSLPIFLVAGAASLLIALLSVGLQVIRASMADPAKSLRYE